jgi:hypothetical protein
VCEAFSSTPTSFDTAAAGVDRRYAQRERELIAMLTNVILFDGTDANGYPNLWVTNGTTGGTTELSVMGAYFNGVHPDLGPIDLTAFGSEVLFDGTDANGNGNLWGTNGTGAGTSELSVAGVGSAGGHPYLAPKYFTVFAGEALFEGTDANNNTNLWETNGTGSGTSELSVVGAYFNGGHPDLSPTDLTTFSSGVLFDGADANGIANLWVTNGTGSGTSELSVAGTASLGGHPELAPTDLTAFGNGALFDGFDANLDFNLWITNGTGAGTSELAVFGAYSNGAHPDLSPAGLTVLGSEVLFSGQDTYDYRNLFVTNGTGGSELAVLAGAYLPGGHPDLDPLDLTVFGSEVLFNGIDTSGDRNLWMTNGTAAGTSELSVVGAYVNGLAPTNFAVFGNEVLFNGRDASNLEGLWVTNGTSSGTREISVTGAASTGLGLNPVGLTQFSTPPIWTHIDNGTPVTMTAGDFENIGSAQIAASYTGAGTYLWANGTGFNKIDNGVPNLMTSGDFAGLGHPQLAGVFAGYGTYTYSSGAGWNKIDNGTPALLTSGDYRGLGHAQLAGVFAGYGTYTWSSSTGWVKIDNGNPTLLTSGNFLGSTDGNNNNSDLAGYFPGYGTYIWSQATGWMKIDAGAPAYYASGNFLGLSSGNNNQTDLAAYFPGQGTFIWSEANGFSKIDNGAGAGLAAVDLTGTSQSQLLEYFSNYGMWEWQTGVNWTPYDSTTALPQNAQQALFATGNFQGGSVVDAAVAFNGAAGMWLDPPVGAASPGSSAQSNASSAAGPAQVTSQLDPAAFATPSAGPSETPQTPDLSAAFVTPPMAASSGTPQNEQSPAFASTVGGLAGQDQPTLGYSENSGNSGGAAPTVVNNVNTANIALLGSYMASSFVTSSDGNGATPISEAAQITAQTTPLAQPHAAA